MADSNKLKSASFNNLAYGASQINNMIRLEKGQPTSITEHLDSDFEELLDRIAPMKNAGSGSTVDITPPTETPIDVDNAINQAIGLPAPPADRAIQNQPEATVQPVQPTKSAKPRKPRTAKLSKSATSSRKQNACNITASLNSKDSATKQGTSTTPTADTLSAAGKEWYD